VKHFARTALQHEIASIGLQYVPTKECDGSNACHNAEKEHFEGDEGNNVAGGVF
jgi:hypothetical protein